MKVLNKIFFFFLCRRYRIKIIGGELLQLKGAKFILPNHPAQIDAQLLGSLTKKHWDIVPVISERFVKMPVVGYFMRRMGAVSVSDLSTGKRDLSVMKDISTQVLKAFYNGKSPILYPAGQIKLTARELIGNKQSAFNVITEMPDNIPIIGVKIKGLWGSMWSRANRKDKPNFGLTFLRGIFYTFANFIFFSPKRNVSIEFVDISIRAREEAKLKRHAFNKYLEEFYDSPEIEEPTYIKHFFYGPKIRR